ncbi:hypothetical protein [Actinomadura rubrisoli]|uniref:hypothetical protein n=1 Tax=Actinomadura rubrisoli TaxID=2530368 RepID=UPI0014055477|nr:hypothetical protein [Actinomadura rubrisoli]
MTVRLHGEQQPELTGSLRAAGGEVIEVTVYRWSRTENCTPLRRLIERGGWR